MLHPGTYDENHPMSEKERFILIEARKYARYITVWLKAFFKFSGGDIQDIDIFDTLLWQVAMTLASAIQENQDYLGSYYPACTPDKVAGALYDTLIHRGFEEWDTRKDSVAANYDWEGGEIDIQPRDGATMPLDEGETGLTEYDICHIEKIPTPSFNRDVTMSFLLQTVSA